VTNEQEYRCVIQHRFCSRSGERRYGFILTNQRRIGAMAGLRECEVQRGMGTGVQEIIALHHGKDDHAVKEALR